MRLISFTESSNTRIGLLKGEHIIDLSQVAPSLPSDMLSFLEAGDGAMLQAARHTSASGHYFASNVDPKSLNIIKCGPNIITFLQF